MNIWFSTGENAWLSNLAERPFVDKDGRKYVSVEHAYQTWKSGTFDAVYYKPWKHGSKFVGKLKVKKSINYKLMCKLITLSFRSNPEVREKFIALGYDATFTHNQGCRYWKEHFPKALKYALHQIIIGDIV